MSPENRIRRHGYHLMSLASVGAVATISFGIFISAMLWLAARNPDWSIWTSEMKRTSAMGNTTLALLTASNVLWILGQLAPLIALRRLGNCLYRNEALARPVADAFRWLAHSLPLYALLHILASSVEQMAFWFADVPEPKFELDLRGGYIFLIACLCMYSVAHLMRLATDAADDVRSIV